MTPLKYNFCYAILSDQGQADYRNDANQGIYYFDTRFLNHYRFEFEDFSLIYQDAATNTQLQQYWSRHHHHQQTGQIDRCLKLQQDGFEDVIRCHNPTPDIQEVVIRQHVDSDFQDMFEIRGQWLEPLFRKTEKNLTANEYQARYVSRDHQLNQVIMEFSPARNMTEGWHFDIQPGQTLELVIRVTLISPLSENTTALPDYHSFSRNFSINKQKPSIQQAIDDVYALLLAPAEGLTIAAGLPRFVTPFGRDALICSFFLLSTFPQLAQGTLQFLAHHQGTRTDTINDEQAGKILHEYRYGERSRIGDIPFHPYFGASDATALFIILLHDYCLGSGDWSFMQTLEPHWRRALQWLEGQQDDETGFIGFHANKRGLVNQCWKDSPDSMSHQDGTLAKHPLFVSEIQAYAYKAFACASVFFIHLNQQHEADLYQVKSEHLKNQFDQYFWQPQMGCYALALDGDQQPLNVQNSNAGHCLWAGIVKPGRADELVTTLFSEALWSGWGLRTLGCHEVRYNPLSYHNGSVWPHDMALTALGLKQYGYHHQAQHIADTLLDVAEKQPDHRLPELYSGHDRNHYPVLPYHLSCRPQAWAAAALFALWT
ncbi:glycogen debranching N-terminal domain-containing protein [Gynuella sunshinyii]|uniref:Glycogen debranching enzyme n=1 Tax=Gynuella sunshinyii YC6258 TaxID=1445510 RepID=A0A0C5VU41_9GAMM|nr:glycogen debranching N-terminal domain-containing protein [Gynuella sunshinyii]AJQ96813.1 glycogen debranching enzyme [Gynuella sunshinyii YC6258]